MHPALSERLAALGYGAGALDVADALWPPALPAADALLGRDAHARLAERLSSRWSHSLQDTWIERHAAAAIDREQLDRLEDAAAAGSLDLASANERAEIVADLHDDDAALAAWRDVLELDPAGARANLAVGGRLLERGDDAGLAHVDRAIEASPAMALSAAEIGYDYLAGRGRHDEAARYRALVNRQLDVLDAAAEERRVLRKSDELVAHGLAPEAVAALSASLAGIDRVTRAYVARRHVVVDAALPGDFFAIPLGRNRWLRRRLDSIDGALIYGR